MSKLSFIIPSRNEEFFTKTIEDVLNKATGDIEVIPIIDGHNPEIFIKDPRVNYLHLPKPKSPKDLQKRHGVNLGVSQSSGDYVMWADAHCMFDKGFDEILIRDHQPNWVQVPRRHRLDPIEWDLQPQATGKYPIDYEYTIYPLSTDPPRLNARFWNSRSKERKDVPIDDIMITQGSCFFMTKQWFDEMGFMKIDGYSGWGQEGEEICYTTWLNGGNVVVNKNTWYAHLHKGFNFKRAYLLTAHRIRTVREFSYDFWVNKHKDFFINHIEKFWPLPYWPENWREKIWKNNLAS